MHYITDQSKGKPEFKDMQGNKEVIEFQDSLSSQPDLLPKQRQMII